MPKKKSSRRRKPVAAQKPRRKAVQPRKKRPARRKPQTGWRRFLTWRHLLLGALVDREVRRVDLADGAVAGEEVLFENLEARVRDVRTGPAGALFVLLPDRIVRVTPAVGH